MRQVTTTQDVFLYSELSDQAKQFANHILDLGEHTEMDFAPFRKAVETLRNNVLQDDIVIDVEVMSTDKHEWKYKIEIDEELEDLKGAQVIDYLTRSGTHLIINWQANEINLTHKDPDLANITGDDAGYTLFEPIHKFLRKTDEELENDQTTLKSLFEECITALRDMLVDEYQSMTTDEYASEFCINNEFEFLADGTIFKDPNPNTNTGEQ